MTEVSKSSAGHTSFVSVQILRAAAALSVYFFHYFGSLNDDFGLFGRNVFELGKYGVDIFFAISGFIICYAAGSETSPIKFFIKRLCRILPLYYGLTLALFMVALVAPGMLNSTEANPVNLLKSLLFVPYVKENGLVQPLLFLGWTLNYEMFFYAVFALSLAAGRKAPLVASGMIVLLVIAGYVFKPEGTVAAFYTSGIMLSFVWGCLVYLVWQHRPEWIVSLKKFWPVFAALLIVQNFTDTGLPRAFTYGVPAAFLLASVLTIQPGDGIFSRFFQAMGDASYSLYLVHPYFLQVVVKVALPLMGLTWLSIVTMSVTAFVMTVVGSWLLFRLFEKPSNLFLRNLLLRTPNRTANTSQLKA